MINNKIIFKHKKKKKVTSLKIKIVLNNNIFLLEKTKMNLAFKIHKFHKKIQINIIKDIFNIYLKNISNNKINIINLSNVYNKKQIY